MRTMCKWLGMLSLAVAMAACSNSDDPKPEIIICPVEGWIDRVYQFDKDGYCPMDTLLNLPDTLPGGIAGYGWIHDATYRIDEEGRSETKNYYEYMIGGGPKHFYFDTKGNLTVFLYMSAPPEAGYYTAGYRYDVSEHSVWIDGSRDTDYRVMQILEMKEDAESGTAILTGLVSLGVLGDGTPVYGLSYYHRATADELAALRKNYPTDLSKLER